MKPNHRASERLARRVQKLEERSQRLSFWRFVFFGFSLAYGLVAEALKFATPFHLITLIGFLIFLGLVLLHQRVSKTLLKFREREKLATIHEGISFLDWTKIPS